MIENQIIFWYRYVDDVITCIDMEKITETLQNINSVNESIQFTMEQEENLTLNYLDLKLSRKNDGTLNFSIFRKPTHTEKYLDFNSNHPLEHKNSVVQSLMHRAFNLCDEELRQQEIDHVSNVLENNGYPKGMIKKFEQRTRRNFSRSNSNNQVGQEPEVEKKSYFYPVYPWNFGNIEKTSRDITLKLRTYLQEN